MRVISGKYKSLKLDGYDIEGIRPTMDKVKESVFAMIQGYLYDSTCLDLFSGSGSLGIEAISNGANYVYFVDKLSDSIKITEKNLESKLDYTSKGYFNIDFERRTLNASFLFHKLEAIKRQRNTRHIASAIG